MSELNETLQTVSPEQTEVTETPDAVEKAAAPKDAIIEALLEAFPEKVTEAQVKSNYPTVRVAPADVVTVMTYLRDEQGMDFLSCLCSADYPEENQIEVVYFLNCYPNPEKRIQVKVRTDRSKPEVPTITGVYPGANWQEREEFDLMGVIFKGHPNLVRVLLPDDFKGNPLRKDFKGVKLC